jgi:hypothetical protein
MNWMKKTGMICWLAAALVVIAGGVTPFTTTLAGESQKQSTAETRPTLILEVVQLKHANAENIAEALRNVNVSKGTDSGLRLVADPVTNSLILRGSADRIREVREVLGKLDVEGPDATAVRQKLSVFDLRSVEPDGALQSALQVVIGKGSANANFSIDQARKTVIVSADPATTDAVRTLLERLETLGTTQGGGDFLVRIVWLLNGQNDGDKLPAPPSDLKEMLPGLVKFGFDQPRVAAQVVVNAQLNNTFQAKGIADKVDLSVSGRLNSRTPSPGLDVTIQAISNDRERNCKLQTDVSAPVGHLVVLGVTPFGTRSSAFVLQVLPKDGKPQPPRK